MTTSRACASIRATIAACCRSTRMRSGSCSPSHARFASAPPHPVLRFYTSEQRVPLKPVIQGLAAVWLVLFLVSFLSLQTTEQRGLARIAAFLTWQVMAFVVAIVGAFTARYAVVRGVERVMALGYVPLALSVFLVVSFIALMAFRVWVAPLFE